MPIRFASLLLAWLLAAGASAESVSLTALGFTVDPGDHSTPAAERCHQHPHCFGLRLAENRAPYRTGDLVFLTHDAGTVHFDPEYYRLDFDQVRLEPGLRLGVTFTIDPADPAASGRARVVRIGD
ncbi:MAG: hypothetical protein R3202_08245 [Candidatus Competibacterales bacterium]|nr:hypothetical protein [Candidatus Competibacterales bacterium]